MNAALLEKLSENPLWIVWSRALVGTPICFTIHVHVAAWSRAFAGTPSFPRKREFRGERLHTRTDIRSFQTISETTVGDRGF